jgi:hypothetical protein
MDYVKFYQDKIQKAFSLVNKSVTSIDIGFCQANAPFCCNLKAVRETG